MKKVDIEKLLVWAYQDELVKGGDTSSASNYGILLNYAELGTRVDDQLGPSMRLPPIFGEPHPDAIEINRLVYRLQKPAQALIIMHARMGTCPDWLPEPIKISAIRDGSRVRIVGKALGTNRNKTIRYAEGTYCPLQWSPSAADIDHAHAEYKAWHDGLLSLVNDLQLTEHIAVKPSAAPEPWVVDNVKPRIIFSLTRRNESLTSLGTSESDRNEALARAGAFAC